ncbi:MAG: bifunctional glutamine synthetase adenylyltransferase/deadenyltransferase, partial [Pusillimonas sp.]
MPHTSPLERALRWSGALRRKIVGNTEFEQWLIKASAKPVNATAIRRWLDEQPSTLPLSVDDTRRLLRQVRSRIFFTLLVRDINGQAPLREVVSAMSLFADLAIARAYKSVVADLAETHGMPLDPATGKPQEMLIIGMGKLGGKELNVSSDIDLIMLYGEEGET